MKTDGSLCNHTSKEGVEVEREGGDFGRMEPVEESAPFPLEWHRWERCLPEPGLHVLEGRRKPVN